MKKTILILLLLTATFASAQIPVTDAAANSTLGMINTALMQLNNTTTKEESSVMTHLKEAYEQTTEMKEGNSKLNQITETYKKVRKTVKEAKLVRKNIEYYFGSLQAYAKIINYLANSENVSEERLEQFDDKMNEMLDSMKDFRKLTTDLIKDDYFEMDDGKRLQLLLEMSEKLKENYDKFSRLEKAMTKRLRPIKQ